MRKYRLSFHWNADLIRLGAYLGRLGCGLRCHVFTMGRFGVAVMWRVNPREKDHADAG